MLRYVIRRLLWAGVLFIAVTLVTFVIFFVIPADPARQTCGQRATPECIARAQHFLGTDRPGARAVRPVPRPARPAAIARALVHEPPGRHARGAAGGSRHRVARLRRRSALADDLDPDRDPLGAAPSFAPRPGDDVRRADRHLRAPRLDRPARRVLRRLQAAPVPDHRLLRVLLRRPATAAARSSGPTT